MSKEMSRRQFLVGATLTLAGCSVTTQEVAVAPSSGKQAQAVESLGTKNCVSVDVNDPAQMGAIKWDSDSRQVESPAKGQAAEDNEVVYAGVTIELNENSQVPRGMVIFDCPQQ